jgi:hypothetical protein
VLGHRGLAEVEPLNEIPNRRSAVVAAQEEKTTQQMY